MRPRIGRRVEKRKQVVTSQSGFDETALPLSSAGAFYGRAEFSARKSLASRARYDCDPREFSRPDAGMEIRKNSGGSVTIVEHAFVRLARFVGRVRGCCIAAEAVKRCFDRSEIHILRGRR